MHASLIRALPLTILLTAGHAQAFVIDGHLDDWGLQRTGQASDWLPNSGIKYQIEDQHSALLDPGYGGQAYDAEAIYMTWDASNLYVALATGHSPLTQNKPSSNSYAAGDLAIDFGNNGSYEFGIELLGSANTQRGHVYTDVDWALGIWKPNGAWTGYRDPAAAGNIAQADPLHPTSILSGTQVGSGTVAYTTVGQNNYGAWTKDMHFFYEVSVPLASFGDNWANGNVFTVHWTQNCANDSIAVDPPITGAVPEPGTLALLPIGMIGLMALRRKRIAPAGQHFD